MPPLNVLIKPVSSSCNLQCSYCFYMDLSVNRSIPNFGVMSLDTLEAMVQQIFACADGPCTIAWQGGEPTLAGLSFYQTYLEYEKKYNTKHLPVYRSIQTNGYGLTAQWASFFAQNHFLVGLSLDGIMETHDAFRKKSDGSSTFSSVMETIRLFNTYRVDYNILTVVNAVTASRISDIYSFYQKYGFHYQQYIACLDPFDWSPAGADSLPVWSLTPKAYGEFLIQLFRLWYKDCLKGTAPYIRQFINYMDVLLGLLPESCEQKGICGQQTVIEADGSVYPCDFYVTDRYRLGNIHTDTLADMLVSETAAAFIQRSVSLPKKCSACPYLTLCRNGCYRHRTGEETINRFCQSYQMFFEECLPVLQELTQKALSYQQHRH